MTISGTEQSEAEAGETLMDGRDQSVDLLSARAGHQRVNVGGLITPGRGQQYAPLRRIPRVPDGYVVLCEFLCGPHVSVPFSCEL
jgi:hypothetical protein